MLQFANKFRGSAQNYLAEEADDVAVVAATGEERQPMLRPAPRRLKASVREDQRRPVRVRILTRIRSVPALLDDDFHLEAGGEPVDETGLSSLQQVGGPCSASGGEGPQGHSGHFVEGRRLNCEGEERRHGDRWCGMWGQRNKKVERAQQWVT